MGEKPSQITLTIFLIKENETVNSFLPNNGSLDRYPLKDGPTVIGDLYVKKAYPKTPGWCRFFGKYIDVKDLGKASSTAGVLVVNVHGRWFAVTFGQGRYLLKTECWEERFGLVVSLNSIGQNQIKSIDKSTFDALSTHSKVQSSQEATPQEFGLDIEQDLVRAVTGSPTDRKLGHRLSGMEALRVSISTTLEQLPNLLERYQSQFHSKAYRKNFPWVDHISEVTQALQKEELDNTLVERVRVAKLERCWMAVPEIVDWASVDGFRYGWSRKNPKHHDIHLHEFLEEVRDPGSISIDSLRQRQVYCIGDDDRQIHQWSVYKCIYCEIDHGGDSYLLSRGKWYRVIRDFVDEVNISFANIPRYRTVLPTYDDDSEAEYNERVAKGDPRRYVLMDKKLIPFGGGNNKFEFCDLYTCDKDIIHVKRYGGSSAFSHLFAQGTASAELFQTQPAFRDLVNKQLPPLHRLAESAKRPGPREYQIVFAVISDSEDTDLTIPFFSRLNLRSAARRLDGYGYRLAITKISVDEKLSKLKRYDPA